MEPVGDAGCDVKIGVVGGGRGPAGEKDEVEEGDVDSLEDGSETRALG